MRTSDWQQPSVIIAVSHVDGLSKVYESLQDFLISESSYSKSKAIVFYSSRVTA
jgi:hypothetical protein